jgi:exodeoxyribonuclease-3
VRPGPTCFVQEIKAGREALRRDPAHRPGYHAHPHPAQNRLQWCGLSSEKPRAATEGCGQELYATEGWCAAGFDFEHRSVLTYMPSVRSNRSGRRFAVSGAALFRRYVRERSRRGAAAGYCQLATAASANWTLHNPKATRSPGFTPEEVVPGFPADGFTGFVPPPHSSFATPPPLLLVDLPRRGPHLQRGLAPRPPAGRQPPAPPHIRHADLLHDVVHRPPPRAAGVEA